MDTQRILEKLDPLGCILLVAGVIVCALAGFISDKLFGKSEKAKVIIKAAALVPAMLGALILLDII
ncbi:MAG: hypothetical protein PHI27_09015 [Eubacteriales bacterium]|nr:hypothetical protein [Eubacteriales bacterium]MDD3882380.1 hypothetical protein [Eubacteriales bacterium]MDD4512399.1 hypothetical protein [Eubacteriales bacterium]